MAKVDLTKNARKTSSKSILILSDVHVGAKTAICSDSPFIKELSTKYERTNRQKAMFEYWKSIKDQLVNGKPAWLFINGEPVNGPNRKTRGTDNWSSNVLDDQISDFMKLMKYIPITASNDYNNIIITRGSGYHVALEQGTIEVEEEVARRLNAFPYNSYEDYSVKIKNKEDLTYTDVFFIGEILDKTINMTHHVGSSRWFAYRTTAPAREAAGMHFEVGKMLPVQNHIDLTIRSHIHYYSHIEFGKSHTITTPAWKFPDPFLFKNGLAGTTPEIGAVEVVIEPNGRIMVYSHLMEREKGYAKVHKLT
ncbi:MAG: hypothetical protein DA328_07990 [Nitrososphaeraceae archaeon]|nr:hypothetical protein [Nitrososphaeraceae archaeon]